jgi:ribosomal protein L24E
MAKKASIAAFFVLLIVGGLLVAGNWSVHRRERNFCGICRRPVSPKLAVVAIVDGKERRVCCARCAVTEAKQEKNPLQLKWVTDFVTGRSINPSDAWFVEESRAMACDHDMAMTDQDKQPLQTTFDRCAPGTFAFSSEQKARNFVQENGGIIRRLPELAKEVQQ